MADQSKSNSGIKTSDNQEKLKELRKAIREINSEIEKTNKIIEEKKLELEQKYGIEIKEIKTIQTYGLVEMLDIQVVDKQTGAVKEHKTVSGSGEETWIKKP